MDFLPSSDERATGYSQVVWCEAQADDADSLVAPAIVRAQVLVDVGAEVANFGPGQVPALDVLASAEEHGAF